MFPCMQSIDDIGLRQTRFVVLKCIHHDKKSRKGRSWKNLYEDSISMKSLPHWYDALSDEIKVYGYTVMLFRYVSKKGGGQLLFTVASLHPSPTKPFQNKVYSLKRIFYLEIKLFPWNDFSTMRGKNENDGVRFTWECTHSHYGVFFRQFVKLGLGDFFDFRIRFAELPGEHRYDNKNNNNSDFEFVMKINGNQSVTIISTRPEALCWSWIIGLINWAIPCKSLSKLFGPLLSADISEGSHHHYKQT